MRRLRAAALLALLCRLLTAAPAQVTMSASTVSATIGEPIELRVVVRAEAAITGMRVNIPAGAYDILRRSARPALESPAGRTFEEVVTIAFFQTGDFTVGPFPVELLPRRAEASGEATGQLTIRVRSLLGEDDKDIQPLKELLEMRGDPRHVLPYALGVLLLLLLVAAAVLLRKKRRAAKAMPAEPPLPPELELERRAGELRAKNLWQAGEFRPFFIALSGMLKHFLERAYGFNAEESTTVETVAGLKAREPDAGIVSGLEGIFTQADLVKFARRVPEEEAAAGIWRQIDFLIAEHKKRRQHAEEAARVPPGR